MLNSPLYTCALFKDQLSLTESHEAKLVIQLSYNVLTQSKAFWAQADVIYGDVSTKSPSNASFKQNPEPVDPHQKQEQK